MERRGVGGADGGASEAGDGHRNSLAERCNVWYYRGVMDGSCCEAFWNRGLPNDWAESVRGGGRQGISGWR